MSKPTPCANDPRHSPAVFILENRRVVCSACAKAGGRQPVGVAPHGGQGR